MTTPLLGPSSRVTTTSPPVNGSRVGSAKSGPSAIVVVGRGASGGWSFGRLRSRHRVLLDVKVDVKVDVEIDSRIGLVLLDVELVAHGADVIRAHTDRSGMHDLVEGEIGELVTEGPDVLG